MNIKIKSLIITTLLILTLSTTAESITGTVTVLATPPPQIITQIQYIPQYIPIWEYIFIPRYINTTEIVYRNNTEYIYVYITPTPQPTPTPIITVTPTPTITPQPTPTITVTVTPSPTTVWDRDNDGRINKEEAIRTINMYFLGVINKEEAIEIILLYFS